jgi:hypothetical protein
LYKPGLSASGLLCLRPAEFLLRLFFDPEDEGDMFLRTTRRYIPEHNILHKHRCVNIKSYILPEEFFDAIDNIGVIRGENVA